MIRQHTASELTDTEHAEVVHLAADFGGLAVRILTAQSTVAVVRKEMNSWKLAGMQLLFYTGLGYVLAVISVQTLRAFGIA